LYDTDYVNDAINQACDNCTIECPPCDNDCPGDYTGDGSVTVGDLLGFLEQWGPL